MNLAWWKARSEEEDTIILYVRISEHQLKLQKLAPTNFSHSGEYHKHNDGDVDADVVPPEAGHLDRNLVRRIHRDCIAIWLWNLSEICLWLLAFDWIVETFSCGWLFSHSRNIRDEDGQRGQDFLNARHFLGGRRGKHDRRIEKSQELLYLSPPRWYRMCKSNSE